MANPRQPPDPYKLADPNHPPVGSPAEQGSSDAGRTRGSRSGFGGICTWAERLLAWWKMQSEQHKSKGDP